MPLIISAEAGFTRELIPADTYVARCVEMLQIGTVETTWQGKPKKSFKIRITWELPDHLVEYEGKQEPARIGEEYTGTLDERGNLRALLKAWRGVDFTPEQLKGFDVLVLLGKPCMLSVVHGAGKDGKTYANISTVSKLMKNMACPDQHHPTRVLTYDAFDWQMFDKLPAFIKKKIEGTPEFKALVRPLSSAVTPTPAAAVQAGVTAEDDMDDKDLPF